MLDKRSGNTALVALCCARSASNPKNARKKGYSILIPLPLTFRTAALCDGPCRDTRDVKIARVVIRGRACHLAYRRARCYRGRNDTDRDSVACLFHSKEWLLKRAPEVRPRFARSAER